MRTSELLRLIEVGASCFIDSGYYHTKLAVFSKSPQAYAFGPFRTYDFIVFMLPVRFATLLF